jgi:hypothetical protein
MSQERLSLPVRNTSQLAWSPASPRLAAVSVDLGDGSRQLSLVDAGRADAPGLRQAVIPSSAAGALRAVDVQEARPLLLMAFEGELRTWDFEAHKPLHSFTPPRPVRQAGLYPDGRRAWALAAAESDSVDWAVWDFEAGRYREFPLERCDHCGRGAALHPSGLLVGACWNAYECGYLLHEVVGEEMVYYSRPAGQRPELEAYAPAFSADGRLFAFICNRYQSSADLGMVCVFEVETGRQVAAFPSGAWLSECDLQFAGGGEELAFAVGEELKVYDPQRGRPRQTHKLPGPVKAFAGHPAAGLYAVALAQEIVLLGRATADVGGRSAGLAAQARASAERILAANARHRSAVGS